MRRNRGNMQKYLRAVMIVCLLSVASCSTPYADMMRNFDAAASCCDSMASFPFRAVALGRRVVFELNKTSPAYVFPSGKSYFAAFQLPPFNGPYRIKIDSYLLADGDTIFLPSVLVLDGRHDVARQFSGEIFQPATTELNGSEGVPRTLTGTIEMDERNRGDRYLVVLTREDLLGAWISTASSGGAAQERIRISPAGRLLLRLERLAQ